MAPPPLRRDSDGATERPRPRRRRARLQTGKLVALLVVAASLLWLSQQEGGASGTFERATDWISDRIDNLTDSGETEDAIDHLNEFYLANGRYPSATELQPATIGLHLSDVDVTICSAHHLVVESFTGSGTGTHLLVVGESWGKVKGSQGCPPDLRAPTPWTVPEP